MNKGKFKIKSSSDGLELEGAMFIPDGNVKGIFQIAHGMSEHKERYYKFMEFIANNGYVAVIHDMRGHGKSVKSIVDLGYFYETKANFIVEDLHDITNFVKKKYKNVPLILFGHSMGSLVVRKYMQKYDDEIDKLIICGSPSKNNMALCGILLAKFIEIFSGDTYRSKLINDLVFGKTKEGESSNKWLTNNEKIIEAYDNDQLCGFIFTLNGFQNLFRLVVDVYSKTRYQMKNKELPIFFIAGADDKIIVSPEKWMESQNFLINCGYKNLQNKLYDGFKHELINEVDPSEVYEDIINFVNS